MRKLVEEVSQGSSSRKLVKEVRQGSLSKKVRQKVCSDRDNDLSEFDVSGVYVKVLVTSITPVPSYIWY